MTLVAVLTVRAGAVEQFRAYERRAATIMARHGGRIERTVVVGHEADGDDAGDGAPLKEIHLVTFPDAQAFAAYQADPELAALAPMRDGAVASAELLVGQPGPDYRPTPPTGERTFQGGCHCRRVRFQVTGDLATVAACNCSICTKKGFLHLIVAPDKFQLLSGEEELSTYRFNTGTAKHTFCRHCGMHPFYVPRSDPDKIDVNVRCLDDLDEIDLRQLTATAFDGRNWEEAITNDLSWR